MSIRPTNPIESLILGLGLDVALTWCPGGDGSTLSSPALAVGPATATDPRAVLVPAGHVWRAAADNDGIHAFVAAASSLRRPNDLSS